MTTYEPHPLALILPSMTDEALDALAADIKANGLQNPIVLYEDKILDGRQREAACKRAGVLPLYLQFKLLPRPIVNAGPLAYVVSQNLHRRHLNESQRAVIAAQLANLPAHRPNKSANLPTAVSQPQAAKLLNVSERSVRTAKRVIREAERDQLKADCLVDVVKGKRRIASVKPESKRKSKRPSLKDRPLDEQVWDRFVTWMKWWAFPLHREVRHNLITKLLDSLGCKPCKACQRQFRRACDQSKTIT